MDNLHTRVVFCSFPVFRFFNVPLASVVPVDRVPGILKVVLQADMMAVADLHTVREVVEDNMG